MGKHTWQLGPYPVEKLKRVVENTTTKITDIGVYKWMA